MGHMAFGFLGNLLTGRKCNTEEPFAIQSVADLNSHLSDLECLWNSGVIPPDEEYIPTGHVSGTLLRLGPLPQVGHLAPKLINKFYSGDDVSIVGSQFIGPVQFLSLGFSCGEWTVGKLADFHPLPKHERFVDGGIVMNFAMADGLEAEADCFLNVPNSLIQE